MKNAIYYQNMWLTKTSKAYELYELWNNSKKPELKNAQKKVLDQHLKELDANYKKMSGL